MAALTEQSRQRNASAYELMCKAGPSSLRSELVEIDAIPGEARYELARLARHFVAEQAHDAAVALATSIDGGVDDLFEDHEQAAPRVTE